MITQLSKRNLIRGFRSWLRNQTNAFQIDEQLLTNSRTARASQRLLQASAIINALTPVLLIGIMSVSVMAQGPSGGSIFGGDDQTIGNGVREAIKWGRNLLFLLGMVSLMWAIINFFCEKNWTKQALGGAFCWAFTGIAALVYSFSQGNAVNLDTDLGN